MNVNTVSPECATVSCCSQCWFDDCACECHCPADEPDELNVCHHGVGFDVECEACEIEIELALDDWDEDEYDGRLEAIE